MARGVLVIAALLCSCSWAPLAPDPAEAEIIKAHIEERLTPQVRAELLRRAREILERKRDVPDDDIGVPGFQPRDDFEIRHHGRLIGRSMSGFQAWADAWHRFVVLSMNLSRGGVLRDCWTVHIRIVPSCSKHQGSEVGWIQVFVTLRSKEHENPLYEIPLPDCTSCVPPQVDLPAAG